jgi:hypothetical protein
MKRSQLLSFDFIVAVIAIIFVGFTIAGVLLASQRTEAKNEFSMEFEYLYSNLENNLNQLPDNVHFIHGYSVDPARFENFANMYSTEGLDKYVLENVGDAHGIGLDGAGYDTCLYFTDMDGPMDFSPGESILGTTKDGHCKDMIDANQNPCASYKDALALFRPVLINYGDPVKNRIVQMNIGVCKT